VEAGAAAGGAGGGAPIFFVPVPEMTITNTSLVAGQSGGDSGSGGAGGGNVTPTNPTTPEWRSGAAGGYGGDVDGNGQNGQNGNFFISYLFYDQQTSPNNITTNYGFSTSYITSLFTPTFMSSYGIPPYAYKYINSNSIFPSGLPNGLYSLLIFTPDTSYHSSNMSTTVYVNGSGFAYGGTVYTPPYLVSVYGNQLVYQNNSAGSLVLNFLFTQLSGDLKI
jgi:hypothetical protein